MGHVKGRNEKLASLGALVQIVGVFTLSARMHERYLFPAAALAIMTYIYQKGRRLLLLSLGFSATIYIDTHLVLLATIAGNHSVSSGPAVIITSLLNIIMLIF